MNQIDWLNNESVPYHLTIKDVLSFPIGKPVNLFLMCRNVLDFTHFNEKNVSKKPSDFFKKCYKLEFIRTEGLKGFWNWENNLEIKEREFDILLENIKSWCPLKNNIIHGHDLFSVGEYEGKHYLDFSENTKLGWRGPMMFQCQMDELPNVVNPE